MLVLTVNVSVLAVLGRLRGGREECVKLLRVFTGEAEHPPTRSEFDRRLLILCSFSTRGDFLLLQGMLG